MLIDFVLGTLVVTFCLVVVIKVIETSVGDLITHRYLVEKTMRDLDLTTGEGRLLEEHIRDILEGKDED